MSLSTNFPTVNPTLNLNFLNAGVLDSRITFSRGSTATYFDQLGVLRTAQNNIPRFDYNPSTLAAQGLLIEEQRTNSILQSQTFDNASWTKTRSSVTQDTAVAPDGTTTADSLVEDSTAANTHDLRQPVTNTGTNTWTFSVYLKAVNRTWGLFELQNATATSNRARAWFDLQNGVVGTGNAVGSGVTYVSHSIQNVGNGWYRCILVGTADSAVTSVQAWFEGTTADSVAGYNGVNGQTSVYVWGAQLEVGAFATSYIPTTTTALTRNADVASMTGTNLSSWFNATAGSLLVQFSIPAQSSTTSLATIGDGTANERMIVNAATNRLGTGWRVVDGGVDQCDINITSSFSAGQSVKTIGAYAVNDFAVCQNGGTVGTDVSGTLPTVNALYIGTNGVTAYTNSYIQRISYYPVRLPNSTLQALTA